MIPSDHHKIAGLSLDRPLYIVLEAGSRLHSPLYLRRVAHSVLMACGSPWGHGDVPRSRSGSFPHENEIMHLQRVSLPCAISQCDSLPGFRE